MLIRAGIAVGLLCIFAADSAQAQRRELREAQMIYQQLPVVKVEGKVVQVAVGAIQLEDKDGNPKIIKLDPKWTQRITVIGTAKPSVLRPGMYVQFTTDLDQRQVQAQEPISEMQIFSPDAGYDLGVASDDPEGKTGPYRVAGQVKTFKDGRLAIVAQKRQIRALVAEDAVVKFEGADYTYARPGDEIKVQGRLYGQGQVLGETVNVTLSQPIEGEEQASSRGRRRGS